LLNAELKFVFQLIENIFEKDLTFSKKYDTIIL